MSQLEACPHCHRHVKISESSCPFCACSLVDAFANRAPRVAPRTRLGRAATFAFGVGVAMTQGACSSDDGKSDTAQRPDSVQDDAGPDGGSDGGSDAGTPQNGDYDGGGVPIYAAAPTSDDGTRLVSRPSRGRSTNS